MYQNQSKFIKGSNSSPGGNLNADLNRRCEGKNVKLDECEEHGGKYVSSFCHRMPQYLSVKIWHSVIMQLSAMDSALGPSVVKNDLIFIRKSRIFCRVETKKSRLRSYQSTLSSVHMTSLTSKFQ